VSAKILVIVNSTGRSYKTDRDRARKKVAQGSFIWRDNFTIIEIERRFQVPLYDGRLGTGNAIPFSHIQNKLRAPHKLHYEIPAVGAHSRAMNCWLINASKTGIRDAGKTESGKNIFDPGAP